MNSIYILVSVFNNGHAFIMKVNSKISMNSLSSKFVTCYVKIHQLHEVNCSPFQISFTGHQWKM